MITIKEQKEMVAEQIHFMQRKMKQAKTSGQLEYYKKLVQIWQAVLDTLTKAEAYGFDEIGKAKK